MKAGMLAVVLLAGCASMQADVNGARNSWYGARYEAVVSQWGAPVRNATLPEGRESYTWVSEGLVSSGAGLPFAIFGGSRGVGVGTGVVVGGAGPGTSDLARCERTLIFRDKSVVDQTWQGHARYCTTFRRN